MASNDARQRGTAAARHKQIHIRGNLIYYIIYNYYIL